MNPAGRFSFLLSMVLMGALLPVPGAQAIGIDNPDLGLGKIDPGHRSVHYRNVTNTEATAVDIEVKVTCPCPVHVQASPTSFRLDPGASMRLEITVDVPLDADPGIHDTRIEVTERSTGGSGGTAVASATINAGYQVRTAHLYLDPPTVEAPLAARFVNAFEETFEITIEGTLSGHGIDRDLPSETLAAPGSAEGARVTRFSVPLPLDESDPVGIYSASLSARWIDPSTEAERISGPLEVEVAHGAVVDLTAFRIQTVPGGLHFTGTVRSVAGEALDAWIRVTMTSAAGVETTASSPEVHLEPEESEEVSFSWSAEQAGTYTVSAQAAYRTASGTEGRSGDWPPESHTVGPTGGEGSDGDSGEAGDGGSDGAGDDGPLGSDDLVLLAVVAVIAAGVGVLVTLTIRRGKGP